MTTPSTSSHDHTVFNPAAGLAAVLLPGAGHLVLGERKRAALIATGVLGLFFGGILIGGIDVIDSREDKVWFFGQALVGPIAFGVDYLHQHAFKGIPTGNGTPIQRNPVDGKWHVDELRLAAALDSARSAYPYETRQTLPVTVETLTADGRARESRTVPMPLLTGTVENRASTPPPNVKSLSKVNELGTLFATIAGMLNVIVIVDAALPGRRKEA